MDILWSPWRYQYIAGDAKPDACVFCSILNNSAGDEDNFILKRAEFNFVILNAYPYGPGHLMIIPYEHISALDEAGKATRDEMMELTTQAQAAISEAYSPDGINLGMNMGRAAGAGVDAHIHMHLLPRWVGDASFMTAIAETRTMAETLRMTYQKLKGRI
jgi:ATP adenylyltransferase